MNAARIVTDHRSATDSDYTNTNYSGGGDDKENHRRNWRLWVHRATHVAGTQ